MTTSDTADEAPEPPIDDARAELQAAVPEAAATIRDLLDAGTNGFSYGPPKRS